MMIENPVLLGIIVMAIVWALRLFAWSKDGWQAVVITMAVSLLVAIGDAAVGGKFASLTPGIAFTVIGEVFLASQVIYQALRRALDVYQATRKPSKL
jgi:hypothetical protein